MVNEPFLYSLLIVIYHQTDYNTAGKKPITHILSPCQLSFELCQPEKENNIKPQDIVLATAVVSSRPNRALELGHISRDLTKTSKMRCGEVFIRIGPSVSVGDYIHGSKSIQAGAFSLRFL